MANKKDTKSTGKKASKGKSPKAKAAAKKTGRPANRRFVATIVYTTAHDAKVNAKALAYLVKDQAGGLCGLLEHHSGATFTEAKATFVEDKTPPTPRVRAPKGKGKKKALKVSG